MRLLPQDLLIQTSAVDHADWNFRPVLGQLQRLRFRLACRLMGNARYGRLLEIGYGSGILMPELATRCAELFGADPHLKDKEVTEALARAGIAATLARATAESLPFPSGYFDCVVCVSAIEYVPDLQRACAEIRRVLRPGGCVIVVTPGHSAVLDAALLLFTGQRASQYGDHRQHVLPTLRTNFREVSYIRFPPFVGHQLCVYSAIRLQA